MNLNLPVWLCGWCACVTTCLLTDANTLAQVPRDAQHLILINYARVQVGLARRASQLTPAEEAQLQKLDDRWTEEQLGLLANLDVQSADQGLSQLKPQVREREAAVKQRLSPQQLVAQIKQAIEEFIEAALIPEHWEAYQAERTARERFRRLALADVLVAAIDRRLYLTSAQRDQLRTKVVDWTTGDLVWQYYFRNLNLVPDIPRDILHEVLSPEQINCLNGVRTGWVELSRVELSLLRADPIMLEP